MTNNERWSRYIEALHNYATRTGNARVPASHIELTNDGTLNLGSWVAYVRQRYRAGLLSTDRANDLAAVPGWEWGPLQPGPAADHLRNAEILTMRAQGISLQKIGDQFGLTRQRIHQIVRSLEEVK
jgi:hypothetical protein